MFSSVQTLDVERYLIQCRRLLLDEIQRSGAGRYGPAGEHPAATAALGPAAWLRPALCIASGMALGAPLGRVLPVAAALELFQAGIAWDPPSASLELAVQRLGEASSPGRAAAAIEFVLEGLHLSNRLNKDVQGRRILYR